MSFKLMFCDDKTQALLTSVTDWSFPAGVMILHGSEDRRIEKLITAGHLMVYYKAVFEYSIWLRLRLRIYIQLKYLNILH